MAKQKEGRGKLGGNISKREGKVQGEKFHSRKVPSLHIQSPLSRRGRGLDSISKLQTFDSTFNTSKVNRTLSMWVWTTSNLLLSFALCI